LDKIDNKGDHVSGETRALVNIFVGAAALACPNVSPPLLSSSSIITLIYKKKKKKKRGIIALNPTQHWALLPALMYLPTAFIIKHYCVDLKK
jgi:hypothetical protein